MEKNSDDNNIELRSEEFQEILGEIPSWILRWGITLAAIIIILIFVGSAFFKYPDIITAKMTLTGEIPAAGIVSKTSGKIQEIYVVDKQNVKKNDYLALIENSANVDDILYLKKYIDSLSLVLDSVPFLPKNEDINLGDIQNSYATFCLTMTEYIQFKELNYYINKIDYTKDRINRYQKYYKNVLEQYKLVQIQTDIFRTQYRRDSLLNANGVLSDEERENTYNSFIQGKLSYESMKTTLDNIKNEIAEMHELLLDTEYQYFDKKRDLENKVKTGILQLLNDIQTWEMNYVLVAPIDGNITFTKYWVENQNVISGDEVFNIVPNEKGKLIGKAYLPIDRSGKVKIGQRVNISFNNFPDKEFGIVRGIIHNISLVPTKKGEINQYILEINLVNGLKTTYGKTLPFLLEMEGEADIVTDDLSLLERFFLPLKKLIKNT